MKISSWMGGILATLLLASAYWSLSEAEEISQIPTVAIPTVTGTPIKALITVHADQDTINVRSGPDSVDFPIIGVLIAGQQVPALGRTPGGLWIQIEYPGVPGGVGWVYSPLVDVMGDLPIVEPPPTPTPRTTPTIDPTLAAQFLVDIPPTRLPTFTPPPPLVIPTFADELSKNTPVSIPMGFVIIGLGVVGLFGSLISLLRGR
jgi:hypothetical protein